MQTTSIRTAQLKLALMALIEVADEAALRALSLSLLERRTSRPDETGRWSIVATAFDELAASISRELVGSLERAADSAGFLAEYAARQGRALNADAVTTV